jgi:hypothetical protein
MKRHRLYWAALPFFFAVALALGVAVIRQADPIGPAGFAKITLGMQESEVAELLASPPVGTFGHDPLTFGKVWEGRNYRIVVIFERDIVVEKNLEETGPDTLLWRIRRWLGL